MSKRVTYPFSAIVAQDKLKLAILLNAINPRIGGVLIQGPKGSGKTTIARGLAEILPNINVVKNCPFNCNPHDPTIMCENCNEIYARGEIFEVQAKEMAVVNLPLGATEDRVVGSLNVEKVIKLGIGALEPGILAEANQNILYVDEINLLPDHIADDLLDAAAYGWNVVEREGISISHPSRFILIGTMNPEEGHLRPQLLDRFPLSVKVQNITTIEDRMEIVRRNSAFETNPKEFITNFELLQKALKDRIIQAREILPRVYLSEKLLEAICRTCLDLKVDGMRPDLIISKTAKALAAYESRESVTSDDIMLASELVLNHRTREGGFLEPANPEEIKKIINAKIKDLKYVEKIKSSANEQEAPRGKAKGRTMILASQEAKEEEEETAKKKRSELASSDS